MKVQLPGQKNLSRIVEVLCTVFQVMGVIIVLSLPWTLNNYLLFKNSYVSGNVYYSMLILLVISGLFVFSVRQKKFCAT